MFPAAMKPEVLGGILADESFQGGGEALGEDSNVIGGAGEFGRVDQVFAADFVAETGPDASGDADGDRRLMLDGQKSNRFMSRCRMAEEIDKESALAGVLIGQERECAVVLEHLDHLVEASRLGNE